MIPSTDRQTDVIIRKYWKSIFLQSSAMCQHVSFGALNMVPTFCNGAPVVSGSDGQSDGQTR